MSYLVPGSLGADNSLNARLPRVGRIRVRFKPRKTEEGIPIESCHGRPETIERGRFLGTIRLRGERGFTETDLKSARGTVSQSFRQVCDEQEAEVHMPRGGPDYFAVVAGRNQAGQHLVFQALHTRLASHPVSNSYRASATETRGRMVVVKSVDISGGGMLAIPEPADSKSAEVEPPAPFHGKATFRLISPTSASWEGDLTVEIPGLGVVALSGENFWSGICQPDGCTKTLPGGISFILIS